MFVLYVYVEERSSAFSLPRVNFKRPVPTPITIRPARFFKTFMLTSQRHYLEAWKTMYPSFLSLYFSLSGVGESGVKIFGPMVSSDSVLTSHFVPTPGFLTSFLNCGRLA